MNEIFRKAPLRMTEKEYVDTEMIGKSIEHTNIRQIKAFQQSQPERYKELQQIYQDIHPAQTWDRDTLNTQLYKDILAFATEHRKFPLAIQENPKRSIYSPIITFNVIQLYKEHLMRTHEVNSDNTPQNT